MNRFIAEKVMGHEEVQYRGAVLVARDKKSEELYGGRFFAPVPDYSITSGKTALMDKCVGEEWFPDFWIWAYNKWIWIGEYDSNKNPHPQYDTYLWRNLRELVAEYKGYKEGGRSD